MAKISAYTEVTPTESDQIPVVQSGDTKKTTIQKVREHVTENSPKAVTHNIASDADYTLTAAQEKYGRIIITDTGAVLTSARNIVCSANERGYYFQNDTAQALTLKTSAGTGIAIPPGFSRFLVCDGTNVLDPATMGQAPPLLHMQERQPSGTSAGASIAGTQTRLLNTTLTNEIPGATHNTGNGQWTLPAGTYEVEISAPADQVGLHRVSARNITDTLIAVLGRSALADPGNEMSDSCGFRKFTIAAAKTFDLRHYTQNAVVIGLGRSVNDGQQEIYADVRVRKVG